MPLDGDQEILSTLLTDLQPMRMGGLRGAGAGRGWAMTITSSASWRANSQLCYGLYYGTEGLRDCRTGGTVGTRHLLCFAALVWRAVRRTVRSWEGVGVQKRKGWAISNISSL